MAIPTTIRVAFFGYLALHCISTLIAHTIRSLSLC